MGGYAAPGGGGEGSAAETTAARGGSVRASDPPLAVGGRLLLDPGRPSRAKSETKLNELEKPRKDCDCDDVVVDDAAAAAAEFDDDEEGGGARKDWLGSRKEWLLVGRLAARSMSELCTCHVVPW